jgi:hypothetical protein
VLVLANGRSIFITCLIAIGRFYKDEIMLKKMQTWEELVSWLGSCSVTRMWGRAMWPHLKFVHGDLVGPCYTSLSYIN